MCSGSSNSTVTLPPPLGLLFLIDYCIDNAIEYISQRKVIDWSSQELQNSKLMAQSTIVIHTKPNVDFSPGNLFSSWKTVLKSRSRQESCALYVYVILICASNTKKLFLWVGCCGWRQLLPWSLLDGPVYRLTAWWCICDGLVCLGSGFAAPMGWPVVVWWCFVAADWKWWFVFYLIRRATSWDRSWTSLGWSLLFDLGFLGFWGVMSCICFYLGILGI